MQQYGLAAVFLGTLLEGEVVCIFSGYFVFLGTLDYFSTALAAFAGAWIAEITVFLIARNNVFARWGFYARLRERVRGAREKFRRGETVLMISFPFIVGTRSLVAFGFGASGSKLSKFLLLATLPTLAWAFFWTGIGFFLGHSAQMFIGRFREFDGLLVLILFSSILIFLMYRKWRNLRAGKKILEDSKE